MKYRILTIAALLVILVGMNSCAHHQYPGGYHQDGQGHAKFY
jgi:hypothetical protein